MMTNGSPISFPMRPYAGVAETPISFASRVAAVNGFPSVSAWSSLVGLSALDIAAGEPEALRQLAVLGGVPRMFEGALAGRGERFTLHGEVLRKADLRRLRLRVCPRCIAADLKLIGYPENIRPYGRETWVVAALRSCEIHDVALVEVPADDAVSHLGGMDFAVALRRHLPHLYDMADSVEECRPSARETYLRSRLVGPRLDGGPLLDRMPFYAASRTCEVVGSVALKGPTATIEGLSEDEIHDAADRGFEIVSKGAESLHGLMSTMVDRVLDDPTARWGVRTMLGALHDAFSHRNTDSVFDPIREVVSNFALRTIPLGKEDLLFGKPVAARRIHTIRSASLETGMHPKTLRRRLAAHGVIAGLDKEKQDDRVIFPAEALGNLPDARQPVLDLAKMGRHLGIPRVHLSIIGQSDLIPAVRQPGTRHEKFGFALDDIEAFRDALFSGSVEVASSPEGAADIATTRRRTNRGVLEILRLALTDTTLTKQRLRGRTDYGALLLEIDEVKARLADEDHGGIPIYKVRQHLGVGDRITKRLITEGIIASRIARNSVNRGEQRVVDPGTITEFRRTFVSIQDLATERGMDRAALRKEMKAKGIAPAFDVGVIGVAFYRRDELAG